MFLNYTKYIFSASLLVISPVISSFPIDTQKITKENIQAMTEEELRSNETFQAIKQAGNKLCEKGSDDTYNEKRCSKYQAWLKNIKETLNKANSTAIDIYLFLNSTLQADVNMQNKISTLTPSSTANETAELKKMVTKHHADIEQKLSPQLFEQSNSCREAVRLALLEGYEKFVMQQPDKQTQNL